MNIDSLYKDLNKANYCLGIITEVYGSTATMQVENLTLLAHRNLRKESLVPNTINYPVIIDADNGLFFGRVYHTKLSNTQTIKEKLINGLKNEIIPELQIDVISVIPSGKEKFELVGTLNVGIANKVYMANQNIVEMYLSSLEIADRTETKLPTFAKMTFGINEYEFRIQPKTLFSRHLMIVGMTNSGKSTSALAILDKMCNNHIKTLIIDPTGEYRTTFSDDEIDKCILGKDTTIGTGELSILQWAMVFETNQNTQPVDLERAIKLLRLQKYSNEFVAYKLAGNSPESVNKDLDSLPDDATDFELKLLPKQLEEIAVQANRGGTYEKSYFDYNRQSYLIEKIKYKLGNTQLMTLFSSKSNLLEKIKKFLLGRRSLYIDISQVDTTDGMGSAIIDIICNTIMSTPNKLDEPFVLFIDEVHRYTKNIENNYMGLVNIAREGRKKGIFLFLTTQSPNDVDKVIFSQIGTLIIHRLISFDDLQTVKNHISDKQLNAIKKLRTGEALLTSVNLLQNVSVNIEKSTRKHDNNTPSLRGE